MKTIIKQFTPPILLSIAKPIFHALKKLGHYNPISDITVLTLKLEHDKRNREASADEIVLRNGLNLRIHPDSRNAFEHFCYLSPAMVDEMDSFLEHTKGKNRLLDIGALHGIFSLVFTKNFPEKKALAVDASPIAFARLLYNIHKNSLTNVSPSECALSETAGTLLMHYEWEHAVAAETASLNKNYLSVVMKTGDDLCEACAFAPDVIKIDVEGHEVKVVKGLLKVIELTRPLIFLELHPNRISQEQDTIEELLHIFVANRYQASLVGGEAISMQEIVKLKSDQRLLLTPSQG
ncbi:hypothetical protein BH11VER1_BH11VER1_10870 [soil metagenome]